ncbi:hypothetical protein C1H46_044212 [Malus baccata]|uniref:KxDL domain-containing protein n=1 Tax=Malus baccata TaxID=106549 RepID=A0A540K8K5_MALBA|nr:hypothetical protein C1H46_044212 [Malus baccata]
MEQTKKETIREASEEVSNEFKTLIDAQDLDSLKQLQHLMYLDSGNDPFCFAVFLNAFSVHGLDARSVSEQRLGRLQDANAVLSHFNEFSENCFAEVSGDFSRNTRLLKSMKTDLEYIFQKLRSMKSRILATYPDAFPDDSKQVLDQRPDLEMPL